MHNMCASMHCRVQHECSVACQECSVLCASVAYIGLVDSSSGCGKGKASARADCLNLTVVNKMCRACVCSGALMR